MSVDRTIKILVAPGTWAQVVAVRWNDKPSSVRVFLDGKRFVASVRGMGS